MPHPEHLHVKIRSMSTRILVVDDDTALSEMIGIMLTAEGYEPSYCADGAATIDVFHQSEPDLVLLDLMLPGLDGVEICRHIREESDVPVIMLTARTDTQDVVAGLEAGADDYVTKPFRLAELLARVRALLRRHTAEPAESELRAQDIRVDVAAHRAFSGSTELQLTAKEFDLLRVLLREAGSVVERDELMREVWGSDPTGSTKTLDMHVSWLRRKLGDEASDPHYITTVRGMGFRFETTRR